MKTIMIDTFGGPEVLRSAESPSPSRAPVRCACASLLPG